MNTNVIQLEAEILLKESFFGLLILAIVAIFNIYSIAKISLTYRRSLRKSTFRGEHYEMLRFIGYIMLLVISILLSLSIWVLALSFFGFVSDWLMALLFVAGFFTTVGNVSMDIPLGWRLIPSIIAFSGLFSFAWATASSISMARDLSNYLEKHK